jgi:hypothetical protein
LKCEHVNSIAASTYENVLNHIWLSGYRRDHLQMHDVAALRAWSVQIGSCGLTNYGPVEASPLRTQGFRHSSALSPHQRRKTGALFIKIGSFEFVRQRHRTPGRRKPIPAADTILERGY